MLTGLTSKIYEGSDTSLRDFALRCVRQLGAGYKASNYGEDELPKDKVPIIIVPEYYYKNLCDAEQELRYWQSMRDNHPEELRKLYDKKVEEHNLAFDKYNESLGVDLKLRDRYENMLKRVEAWDVKEDYLSLKELMIKQLKESIAYDCRPTTITYEPFMDYDLWLKFQIECSEEEVRMCKERLEKEEKSVRETNEYLKGLYQAIDEAEPLNK